MTEQTTAATCKYPGCENTPEAATARAGRRPEYCADPAHNPVTAWRERKRAADAERLDEVMRLSRNIDASAIIGAPAAVVALGLGLFLAS